jgi:hypothetical protein
MVLSVAWKKKIYKVCHIKRSLTTIIYYDASRKSGDNVSSKYSVPHKFISVMSDTFLKRRSTSSVTTRRYVPEYSKLHTRRRKNLKSHMRKNLLKFRIAEGRGDVKATEKFRVIFLECYKSVGSTQACRCGIGSVSGQIILESWQAHLSPSTSVSYCQSLFHQYFKLIYYYTSLGRQIRETRYLWGEKSFRS